VTSDRRLPRSGQSASGPGSVTTLPVTWEHSPNMPLDLLFYLSWLLIVSASFRPLADLRRNWQTSSDNRCRTSAGSSARQSPPRQTVTWTTPACAAWSLPRSAGSLHLLTIWERSVSGSSDEDPRNKGPLSLTAHGARRYIPGNGRVCRMTEASHKQKMYCQGESARVPVRSAGTGRRTRWEHVRSLAWRTRC
jgi:hypothetical protein